MSSNRSVDFFDRQFERQIHRAESALNPFEHAALPHLRGRVLVSIGLLMFLDCASAHRALDDLQAHLVPGGTLLVNVLVEGTTYMDMFDPQQHCLFPKDFLQTRLAGWEVIASGHQDFAAPGNTVKSFATIVARKP